VFYEARFFSHFFFGEVAFGDSCNSFSRNRKENWRRVPLKMGFYTFSILGQEQVAGIQEEVDCPLFPGRQPCSDSFLGERIHIFSRYYVSLHLGPDM